VFHENDDDDMARMIDEITSGVPDPAVAANKNKKEREEATVSDEAKLLEEPEVLLQKRVVTLKISQPFPCLSSLSLAAASLQRLATKHAHEMEDLGAHLASKLVPSSSNAAPVGRGQPVDPYVLHNQMMKEIITSQRLRALQSAAAVKPIPSGISNTSKARSTNANSTPTTTSLQHPIQPLDETTATPLHSDIDQEEGYRDHLNIEDNGSQTEDSLIIPHRSTESPTVVEAGPVASVDTPLKALSSIGTSLVVGPPHSPTPKQATSSEAPSKTVKPKQQSVVEGNTDAKTTPTPPTPPPPASQPFTTANDLAYLDSPEKEEKAVPADGADDAPEWL
jgi:hypothetical protein